MTWIPMMLSALLALPAAAQAPGESPAVPKQVNAGVQLAYAKNVKAKAKGTKGAARVSALQEAAAAYAAVSLYWPDSGGVLAEAAFRRGEIHRTLDQAGAARAAFQEAFDAGGGTDFAPRALLEIGHLHRRASEFDLALETYQKVMGLAQAPLRYRNDAQEWLGKVQLELSNWKEAEAAFARWAADAEGPVEVVRAVDLQAQALLGAGEVEKAEAVVQGLQENLESLAAEPSKEGEALRKALDRMKAPELIAAAKAAAAGS